MLLSRAQHFDPILLGSSLWGILHARTLEGVAVPFSRGLMKQGGHNTELALVLKQPMEAKQNLSL